MTISAVNERVNAYARTTTSAQKAPANDRLRNRLKDFYRSDAIVVSPYYAEPIAGATIGLWIDDFVADAEGVSLEYPTFRAHRIAGNRGFIVVRGYFEQIGRPIKKLGNKPVHRRGDFLQIWQKDEGTTGKKAAEWKMTFHTWSLS